MLAQNTSHLRRAAGSWLIFRCKEQQKQPAPGFSDDGESRWFTSLWCELALGTYPFSVMPAKAGTRGLPPP